MPSIADVLLPVLHSLNQRANVPMLTDGTSLFEKRTRVPMSCPLLHTVEQPDPRPYDDPDLKDLVGSLPRFFCASQMPPRPLRPTEGVALPRLRVSCWMSDRVAVPQDR